MNTPIKPTVGRVVLYTVRPGDEDFDGNGGIDPSKFGDASLVLPAVIVRVWSDTCVNLKVLNDGPNDVWKASVCLKPRGENDHLTGFWEWMPYQLGQAAKVEKNERERNEPLLGLATTGDILKELTARCEVNGTLGYRTVDEAQPARDSPYSGRADGPGF